MKIGWHRGPSRPFIKIVAETMAVIKLIARQATFSKILRGHERIPE